MGYLIKRGEQTFGPYALTDLQRYVQSGNVLVDDLAQSEGLTDWVAVRQILGDIPATVVPVTTTAAVPAAQLVPLPPNLHWALLLILNVLTSQIFNLFNIIWAFILANWGRKLSGDNKPLVLVSMYPAGVISGIMAVSMHVPVVGGPLIIGGVIAYLFGIFSIRDAMETYYNSTENIGLTLSGVMTFFFSTVYLQYHVNRIHRWKKTGVLSS